MHPSTEKLIKDIANEKPILILYDQALFFAKLVLKFYAKKNKCKLPLHASYVTSFLCVKGIYPNWSDLNETRLIRNSFKNLSLNLFIFCRE